MTKQIIWLALLSFALLPIGAPADETFTRR